MVRTVGDPFVVVEEEEAVEGVVEHVEDLLGGPEGDQIDELDDGVFPADRQDARVVRAGQRVDLRLSLQFLRQQSLPSSESPLRAACPMS